MLTSEPTSLSHLSLHLKKYPTTNHAEASYWSLYSQPITTTLPAKVTAIDVSPIAPYDLLVSASSRITVFDSQTGTTKRTFTRFEGEAYSGKIRPDGKLFVCGGAVSKIQIFELSSRLILRTFEGHKNAIHVTKWNNLTSIMSCSDVRSWDLPNQTQVSCYEGHTDYIRCGIVHDNLWYTGSYDHTIKIWDNRCSTPCISTLQHDSAVMSLLVLPNGNVVAGGDTVKIWSHNKLIKEYKDHIKPITALTYEPQSKRIISGGLDSLCKFYDELTLDLKYTMPIKGQVLSMAVTDKKFAVGLVDGNVIISTKLDEKKEEPEVVKPHFFFRGKDAVASEDDFKIEHAKRQRLQPYDIFLKKFQYTDALNSALESKQPVVIVSLIDELIQRDCLTPAIAGRDELSLEPILHFLTKNLTNPNFALVLIQCSNVILDCYSPSIGNSSVLDQLLTGLSRKLHEETLLQRELLKLQGSLDMIFASSQLNTGRLALEQFENDSKTIDSVPLVTAASTTSVKNGKRKHDN